MKKTSMYYMTCDYTTCDLQIPPEIVNMLTTHYGATLFGEDKDISKTKDVCVSTAHRCCGIEDDGSGFERVLLGPIKPRRFMYVVPMGYDVVTKKLVVWVANSYEDALQLALVSRCKKTMLPILIYELRQGYESNCNLVWWLRGGVINCRDISHGWPQLGCRIFSYKEGPCDYSIFE